MANIVNRFKIMDGPSHVTLHTWIAGDGVSGDLTNLILLDPADDVFPAMPKRQAFVIKRIWFEVTGFSITLLFNSLNPWPAWTITGEGHSVEHDWRFFGGIRDYSDMPLYSDVDTPGMMTGIPQDGYNLTSPKVGGLSSDGKLLISTMGMADVTDRASMVLWLEKRDSPNPQS